MIKNFFNKLEEVILITILVSITLILGFQIVFRYILRSSLSWSEEFVRLLFIWCTFMCVPYTIKHKGMLNISLIPNRSSSKSKLIMNRVVDIIMVIVFTILAFFSIVLVAKSLKSNQTTPAMGLPIWTMYAPVLVGSTLSIVRLIQKS